MFKLINKISIKNNYELHFRENKKDRKVLFYILCGYKDFMYDNLFRRLDKYFDIDADVCLATAGKFDNVIAENAKKRNWCYLSCKKNNVSITQNAIINVFSKAKIIIKMDEDILVTKGTFKKLLRTYEEAKTKYPKIAFVAPLININGYATPRFLEILNVKKETEKIFGSLHYGSKIVLKNSDFVKYIWNNFQIDETNEKLEKLNNPYTISPAYFSIGLILFTRDFYNRIGYILTVPGKSMGADEFQMNFYASVLGYRRVICQTAFCGHLSYGPTNKEMKEHYLKAPPRQSFNYQRL